MPGMKKRQHDEKKYVEDVMLLTVAHVQREYVEQHEHAPCAEDAAIGKDWIAQVEEGMFPQQLGDLGGHSCALWLWHQCHGLWDRWQRRLKPRVEQQLNLLLGDEVRIEEIECVLGNTQALR